MGQSATLVLFRDVDGKLDKRTVTVVLTERPLLAGKDGKDFVEPAKPGSKDLDPKGNGLHLGVTLAELTPQLVADRHLVGVRGLYIKEIDPSGLVAEVRVPQSGQQALGEGDVITRINRVPVNSLADFQRVVNGLKPGDPIVLNVVSSQRQSDRLIQRIVQFTYQ